jgi:hypothetical protein
MAERLNYTIQTLGALDDGLSTDAYLIEFAKVPGGGGTSYDMAVRCTNVPIPETTSEPIEAEIHGFKVLWRGRRRFGSNDWAPQFIETKNGVISTAIRSWIEYCAGTDSGNSAGYKADYSTMADVTIFDTTGKEALKYRFFNVWARGLDEQANDSASNEVMRYTAHFAYDYFTQIGTNAVATR